MAITISSTSAGGPASGQLDALVGDICEQLRPGSSEPAHERIERGLTRLLADLAFDSGLVVRLGANGHGEVVVTAGAPVDSALADVITWPWVARAARVSGLLVLGVPEGNTDVAADDRRRLWALGVGTFVCIPLQNRDFQRGAVLLCSRHSSRLWTPTAVPALVTAAEAFRRVLEEAGDLQPREEAEPDQAKQVRRMPQRGNGAAAAAPEPSEDGIVGESPAWRYVMFRVDQVAATQATVLLLGETGTGKELVARAIHRRSARANGKFVALNCSALPTGLVESELFGREKGAFTGAHAAQPGRFEIAHRGTLFLDEVGELPLELQPKLLRVLQEGQFDRLGSSRTIGVDVRVIAATNRDLAEDVRQGRFRLDLFYRLNVFPITLPSLRDRREDIPLLVNHLVARFARILRKPAADVPAPVMRRLTEHDWPGNIRELENVIQRAIIQSANGTLSLGDITLATARPASGHVGTTLESVEREHILHVLGLTAWRIEGARGAAQLLGLKPSTLRSRLRKLGVRRGA